MADITRIEKFLGPIRNIVQGISEGHTRPKPVSRVEHYLDDIATALEAGGGGGGTSDYTDLSNKPSINGVTLTGDKTLADLGNRFIITLTENADSYTADKTFAEIKEAFEAGKELICRKEDDVDLLLSCAEINMQNDPIAFYFFSSTVPLPKTARVASDNAWSLDYSGTYHIDGSNVLYSDAFLMILSTVQSLMTTAITELATEAVGTTKAYTTYYTEVDDTARALVRDIGQALSAGLTVDTSGVQTMGFIHFRPLQGYWNSLSGVGSAQMLVAGTITNEYGTYAQNIMISLTYDGQSSTVVATGTIGKVANP